MWVTKSESGSAGVRFGRQLYVVFTRMVPDMSDQPNSATHQLSS